MIKVDILDRDYLKLVELEKVTQFLLENGFRHQLKLPTPMDIFIKDVSGIIERVYVPSDTEIGDYDHIIKRLIKDLSRITDLSQLYILYLFGVNWIEQAKKEILIAEIDKRKTTFCWQDALTSARFSFFLGDKVNKLVFGVTDDYEIIRINLEGISLENFIYQTNVSQFHFVWAIDLPEGTAKLIAKRNFKFLNDFNGGLPFNTDDFKDIGVSIADGFLGGINENESV